MNATNQDPATSLLATLEDEIELLVELSTLSTAARDAALEPDAEKLAPILERKSAITSVLARRRDDRAKLLADAGHAENDLLVYLLGLSAKEDQPAVVRLMSRYVDTQKKTAEEISRTRDFFEVALDLVEEMREALVPRDDVGTYDPTGSTEAPVIPIALSQLT